MCQMLILCILIQLSIKQSHYIDFFLDKNPISYLKQVAVFVDCRTLSVWSKDTFRKISGVSHFSFVHEFSSGSQFSNAKFLEKTGKNLETKSEKKNIFPPFELFSLRNYLWTIVWFWMNKLIEVLKVVKKKSCHPYCRDSLFWSGRNNLAQMSNYSPILHI